MSSAQDDTAPVSFLVAGQPQDSAATRGALAAGAMSAAVTGGTVKVSLRLGAARAGAAPQRVTAVPGQDIVALHIAGGPVLLLHPRTAHDLMRAQARDPQRRGPSAAQGGGLGEAAVPSQLGWPGLEQAPAARAGGLAGKVLLAAFEIIGLRPGLDNAADLAASAVVAQVDGQVEAGVYALSPEALGPLKGSGRKLDAVPASPEPLLVLLHGTFVDTASTFGALWRAHPERVRALFAHYGGRVFALDHPTLGASPIANALTLVQALPQGARLHLATHSRGGLVAEVLARVCGQRGAPDLSAFEAPEYAAQRQELLALARLAQAKALRVERVLRVACPARGTLLASRRLDAYLSVLGWTLQASGVPLLPALADFVAEVARRRADPGQLPGLAAMMPGSPLVNWLNGSGDALPGDLRVLAGDQQGDSLGSWLKTLLADAYYWTDNDIVVQTRSMYGGTPREGGALFLLDRGGQVNHFNYFSNERSARAVLAGLTEAQPDGFALIGPLSWAGLDASGVRASKGYAAYAGPPPAERPAVFVLPGILGSHLAVNGRRVWLSLRLVGGFDQLAYTGAPDGVQPDGPVGAVYNALIEHLAASHEVIPFAFDWRRPLEQEARRLADAVDAALAARQASGQPVRLLAHSMGGVLARVMQLERPDTFQRLMAHPGARLLMLGTPNSGSWAPMQVLTGDDTFGNALVAFGSPLANQRARQLIAQMPGLLQLQAGLLDPALGLAQAATWQRLADADFAAMQQLNWWHGYANETMEPVYRWGLPPQPVLDAAVALRRRLDAQCTTELPAWAGKLCLVVGHARQTPVAFDSGAQGFVYVDAIDEGDGRVPLASALLPGVKTWQLDAVHGDMPSQRRAFDAFVDLLQAGDTLRLPALAGVAGPPGMPEVPAMPATTAPRSAAPATRVLSRPSHAPTTPRPAGDPASVFAQAAPSAQAAPTTGGATGSAFTDAAAAPALRISVLNGNLAFIAQPLLLGHYGADKLSGTEAVVDRLLGGTLSQALAAGLYPEACGTQQVFLNTRRDPLNPWQAPRPQGVIVVGLGKEGALRQAEIVASVRQGALAWAQRVAEDPQQGGAVVALAATLLGSGGVGVSAADAAAAVARGVQEANRRLQAGGWPVVGRLTLVELYLDRATEAWQGLRMLATASPGDYALDAAIQPGSGPLRRQLDSGYRGANYDLISITAGEAPDSLSYTVDTRRARAEVRGQATQGRLVRDLVARAAQDAVGDPQIGRTLFQLLVPLELEASLGGTERLVLELDASTAPIPWELLDVGHAAGGDGMLPWALRTQLLRRLRSTQFRSLPRDASADDAMLVIGDPLVDDPHYPSLAGARQEAAAVQAQLAGPGGLEPGRLVALPGGAEAGEIIGALLQRPYRIVHIAGHGDPVVRDAAGRITDLGGVVLSGGLRLGAHEIESMRSVPELVFVNCCHLAAFGEGTALQAYDRSAFAASVADALIAIGVRCVVAAGWAVDDDGAALFAATFYRELLAGTPFMGAAAAARKATWDDHPEGKTWAAYQCYGDPDWTYRLRTGDAQAAGNAAADAAGGALQREYDAVASPVALALALEEVVTRTRWMGAARAAQLDRLRHLEGRFDASWGDIGAVAEAFGLAWAECGEPERALAWYARALQCNDGSASLKAQEQWLNLSVRVAAMHGLRAQTPGALDAARATVADAVGELQPLCARHPTLERLSLQGAAHKRQAQLDTLAGDSGAAARALAGALQAYSQAEALAAQAQHPDLFYPALNRMAVAIVLGAGRRARTPWDRTAADAVRASLQRKLREAPDFWSHAGLIELALYEAAASGDLAARAEALNAAIVELHGRVQAPWMWASVAEQALFVLQPMLQGGPPAEQRAAALLLQRLGALAQRRPDELQRWQRALQGPAQAQATTLKALGAPVQGTPPRPEPEQAPIDAVVWQGRAGGAAAAAVAALLQRQGLRVWQRAGPGRSAPRLPGLEEALRQARLAVVVLDSPKLAPDEATLADWSLLQAAAWRSRRPAVLATVAGAKARVPAFLVDTPRLNASALANDPAAVQALLAQLPDAEPTS